MTNKCSLCGKPASHERESIDQPPEGEVYNTCFFWVCVDCVDWEYMDKNNMVESICVECAKFTIGGKQ